MRGRFKGYPKYKDTGVEWLGIIPAHWGVRKWRYCCRITEGQVAPDDDRYRERVLIAPNHIESGTGRILYTETSDEQGAISGKYLVSPGDIIYSKIRPALNKACIAKGDWLCSADMYPVKVTYPNLRAPFLLYFILSDPFVRPMVDESMRVAMPKVNRDKLAACPLVIPPPDEQRAIVTFLERETARIDELIAGKERLIALLQEQRAASIARIVMHGLVADVPMKDSGVAWLGHVPAHWGVMRNRWLFREPATRSILGEEELLTVSHLTGVTRRSEKDVSMIEAESHEGYKICRAGELAINTMWAWMGALGIAKEDGMVSPSYAVYRIVHPSLHSRYYDYLSRAGAHVYEMASRSTGIWRSRLRLYPEAFFDIWTPLPPREEQVKISDFLDVETARINRLLQTVQIAIDRLRDLRAATISAAVTGRIDVREASS